MDGLTDGQATTALLARSVIRRPDRPLLIYNIDTHCDPAVLRPESVRGAGWIPCFSAPGSAWSFALADGEDRIVRIAEKNRISDDCTLGLYWFNSFETYEFAYRATYPSGSSGEPAEKYIAPMYNSLIASHLPVYIERIPSSCVIPIGTPAEYRAFRRSTPPSRPWRSTVGA